MIGKILSKSRLGPLVDTLSRLSSGDIRGIPAILIQIFGAKSTATAERANLDWALTGSNNETLLSLGETKFSIRARQNTKIFRPEQSSQSQALLLISRILREQRHETLNVTCRKEFNRTRGPKGENITCVLRNSLLSSVKVHASKPGDIYLEVNAGILDSMAIRRFTVPLATNYVRAVANENCLNHSHSETYQKTASKLFNLEAR